MPKCVAFVSSNVIGLVALDFVLRVFFRGTVRVPLVIEIFGVNGNDGAADPAGLGIPADVITHLEWLARRHGRAFGYKWKYQTGAQASTPAKACKAKIPTAYLGWRRSHLKAKNAMTGICKVMSS